MNDARGAAQAEARDEGGGTGKSPASVFAEIAHRYVREMIQLADQKAAFVSSLGSALLAYLHHARTEARWLKSPALWMAGDVLALFTMVTLALAVLGALLVVVPRTRGSQRGYLFWASINQFEQPADYGAAVAKLTSAELANAVLLHCWELSQVCGAKYRALNVSIRCGTIGLASCVLYFLLVG
jgi:hypothetical protein